MTVPDDIREKVNRLFVEHDDPDVIYEALCELILSERTSTRNATLEEAAKIAVRQAPATQDWADAPLQALSQRIATAIRKGKT